MSVLTNCNDETRFNDWIRAGGALLGIKNIGCGINSLTYLGVFTRPQGEQLVPLLNTRGTTFDEMMNYVFNASRVPQIKIQFDISTPAGVEVFINSLTNLLCEGCCTIVKLMTHPEIPEYQLPTGHTIIFSKNERILYATDPHIGTRRPSNIPDAAFNAWQNRGYLVAHVMFNMSGPPPSFPLQNDNAVEGIRSLPDHGPIDDRGPVPMDLGLGGKNKKSKKTKKSKKSKKPKKSFTMKRKIKG